MEKDNESQTQTPRVIISCKYLYTYIIKNTNNLYVLIYYRYFVAPLRETIGMEENVIYFFFVSASET